MNTYKMSTRNLFNLACDVLDTLEEMPLLTSMSNLEIYTQLEEKLGYSLRHIQDVFSLATGMGLAKYIKRCKYTNILTQMSGEEFAQLKLNAKVCGIKKFKSKSMQEFPKLIYTYDAEYLQLPIDKAGLLELLDVQITKRGEKYLMRSLYKDIVKGRKEVVIQDYLQEILIRNEKDMLIDLENTYFVFKDTYFRIKATINTEERVIVDSFLSMIFGQSVYATYNQKADANTVLHLVQQFMIGNSIKTNGFALIIEYGNRHGWGMSHLISSMSFDNEKLKNVKFVEKPFLVFDGKKVKLNVGFFD